MGNRAGKHKNYYRILGVSHDASDAEITKAFRSLSMKYHPDKNASSEAEAMFKDINEAYHVLVKSKNAIQYENVDKNAVKANLEKRQEMQEENDVLHGFFTCSKCEADISKGGIIFQCGHMSCVYCSNTVDVCQNCQQPIERRQEICL